MINEKICIMCCKFWEQKFYIRKLLLFIITIQMLELSISHGQNKM